MGNSMKTGPGVPDWAMARAFLTVGTISLIVLIEAQNLHSGLKRDIWSMSCSAPLPCNTSTAVEDKSLRIRMRYNMVKRLSCTALNSCRAQCSLRLLCLLFCSTSTFTIHMCAVFESTPPEVMYQQLLP